MNVFVDICTRTLPPTLARLGHLRKAFLTIISLDDRAFKRALFTLSLDIDNSPPLLFYSE